MELMGGITIMLVLLGLFFAAVWLSLPILIIGLGRRLEQLDKTMERLELRMAVVERRLDRIQENLEPVTDLPLHAVFTEPEQGGPDGIA